MDYYSDYLGARIRKKPNKRMQMDASKAGATDAGR